MNRRGIASLLLVTMTAFQVIGARPSVCTTRGEATTAVPDDHAAHHGGPESQSPSHDSSESSQKGGQCCLAAVGCGGVMIVRAEHARADAPRAAESRTTERLALDSAMTSPETPPPKQA
ncbi:MAG: hypothetical protein FJ202_07890 [Gemmatimonadetes bacterium]|nr:hypothetical protein [Gemmatimonadota bacterium]